jgi:hypothetical protein
MPEKATPEFYRQEAQRLTALATVTSDAALRLEIMEIAACFRRLANHADTSNEDAERAKSARRAGS